MRRRPAAAPPQPCGSCPPGTGPSLAARITEHHTASKQCVYRCIHYQLEYTMSCKSCHGSPMNPAKHVGMRKSPHPPPHEPTQHRHLLPKLEFSWGHDFQTTFPMSTMSLALLPELGLCILRGDIRQAERPDYSTRSGSQRS